MSVAALAREGKHSRRPLPRLNDGPLKHNISVESSITKLTTSTDDLVQMEELKFHILNLSKLPICLSRSFARTKPSAR